MNKAKVLVKIEDKFGGLGVSIYINGDLVKHTTSAISLVNELTVMEMLELYDIHFE
ncbi:MAG: hypothetical protein WC992_07700 [Acholeplasmataceae bacterium]